MLARTARLLVWTGRYLERAENNCRILDVASQLALDLPHDASAADRRQWEPVVHACGSHEQFFELHGEGPATEAMVAEFVLFDRRNPSSVVSCVAAARENVRCLRDLVATEMWEHLNRVHLRLRADSPARYAATPSHEYLEDLRNDLQLFEGITASMWPRDEHWAFLRFARLLERADNVSRLVDVKYFTLLPSAQLVGSALDVVQWAAVLRSCSAFEAYRRERRGRLTLERILDYLLLDRRFPRSVRFCVTEAAQLLARVARGPDDEPWRALATIEAWLEAATATAIIEQGLHETIDRLQIDIAAVFEAVDRCYSSYPSESAPLLG